jgi:hypothetical protein
MTLCVAGNFEGRTSTDGGNGNLSARYGSCTPDYGGTVQVRSLSFKDRMFFDADNGILITRRAIVHSGLSLTGNP